MKLYSCEKESNIDRLIPKELEDLSNIDDQIYTANRFEANHWS